MVDSSDEIIVSLASGEVFTFCAGFDHTDMDVHIGMFLEVNPYTTKICYISNNTTYSCMDLFDKPGNYTAIVTVVKCDDTHSIYHTNPTETNQALKASKMLHEMRNTPVI